jgi:hypothetical protein
MHDAINKSLQFNTVQMNKMAADERHGLCGYEKINMHRHQTAVFRRQFLSMFCSNIKDNKDEDS